MSNLTLSELLKEHGLSYTKPRQTVFNALLAASGPVSIQELIAACAASIDRASVYRTIDTLARIGVVHRVPAGLKYKVELSELFRSHHHHLTCLRCGRTASFDNPAIEQQIHSVAAGSGFAIRGHQLEVQGLCGACLAKTSS